MTLKEYVKSLAERIYRIENEGGGGSQGGATKEYVDTKVATATGILQNEIGTTNQVVDGNIADISTLQNQMSTAQGDIAQLEIDVDTNTEDIGNNTTAIGNNTQLINQVNGQVEINTADIGTLSGRVTSVETKATNTETLVGNQTDLPDTSKSVALNVAQLNNKITRLLWSNTVASQQFNAQTITINNLSDYDYLMIIFSFSDGLNYFSSIEVPKVNHDGFLSSIYFNTTNNGVYRPFRKYTLSGNAITFDGGYLQINTGNFTQDNYYAQPRYILGCKTNS